MIAGKAALADDAVAEVGHGEDGVEIVPLQHAISDGELPEAARLKVATDGRVRSDGGPRYTPYGRE